MTRTEPEPDQRCINNGVGKEIEISSWDRKDDRQGIVEVKRKGEGSSRLIASSFILYHHVPKLCCCAYEYFGSYYYFLNSQKNQEQMDGENKGLAGFVSVDLLPYFFFSRILQSSFKLTMRL